MAGILLGVFANYLAMFFPLNAYGFFTSIFAVLAISWFFLSRFFIPIVVVFQNLHNNIKAATFFTSKNDFNELARRFLFKANMAGTTFNTLFKLSKSGLKESSTLSSSNYFFPLNKQKHIHQISKTISFLELTDSEKKELEDKISEMYGPIWVQCGQAFKYRHVKNCLLRGKGIFFLNEFGNPGIGCIITPSPLSTLSRHFEQYHANLRKRLQEILLDLLNDERFASGISEIFKEGKLK
jgi:hypothetical protein